MKKIIAVLSVCMLVINISSCSDEQPVVDPNLNTYTSTSLFNISEDSWAFSNGNTVATAVLAVPNIIEETLLYGAVFVHMDDLETPEAWFALPYTELFDGYTPQITYDYSYRKGEVTVTIRSTHPLPIQPARDFKVMIVENLY